MHDSSPTKEVSDASKLLPIILVGAPNSGKTVLFNALTHAHALTGNWAGVTVTSETGTLTFKQQTYTLQDLPGIHTLMHEPLSEDAKLTYHAIIHQQNQAILHVVNACHLTASLSLTSELAELGQPMIIVLTMIDLAQKQGISVETDTLAQLFQCPIIPIDYHQPQTLIHLKETLCRVQSLSLPTPLNLSLSPLLAEKVQAQPVSFTDFQKYQQLLQDNTLIHTATQIAQARHIAIQQQISAQPLPAVPMLDHFLLHRFLGLPCFLIIMYLLFFFTVHVGGLLQPFFDLTTTAVFVQGTALLCHHLHVPNWLTMLLSQGVGKGLNTTLTFIPTLFTLYFALGFLEGSGYMARAAFIMDKCMRLLKLPGQAFIPLILGFGCNVPAILATRALTYPKDRLLTILMIPFMSCSARLTIYTVFVSLFFPENGQNVIFLLYCGGILIAILTGLILQKTQLSHQLSPFILELPAYQLPTFRKLSILAYFRLKQFLKRAFIFILSTCLILSMLNILPSPHTHTETFLAYIATIITPLFEPMGLTAENWPATVSLITGILAKEIVIGALNTLYQQIDTLSTFSQIAILDTLWQAVISIKTQCQHLGIALLHPLNTTIKIQDMPYTLKPIFSHYFTTPSSIYAYLTFILLYMPCASTMVAIKQETSTIWMWFSILWSFFLAYMLAVDVYQIAHFAEHPMQTLLWVTSLGTVFCILCQGLKWNGFSVDNTTSTQPCTTACSQCAQHIR